MNPQIIKAGRKFYATNPITGEVRKCAYSKLAVDAPILPPRRSSGNRPRNPVSIPRKPFGLTQPPAKTNFGAFGNSPKRRAIQLAAISK